MIVNHIISESAVGYDSALVQVMDHRNMHISNASDQCVNQES